ncbi:DNA topology modulation protein [Planococcus sp. PAMC 21323]|uniref:topology modulation protein n=1 Tax=Planococcus sp. PAMC 21323 TaxID=1526927 RepID=UPI000571604E|nr:topology modulation protein [Planococcus sp. PAMC 21323]AIY04292.1 DNA topology modulation protein [Planococcus sp. PAMC 21323]
MNRIIVLGVSAGVGKSSFARKLSDKTMIPVYHLDAYFWKPGWVENSEEEFSAEQRKLVAKEQWIIEGNYSSTYGIRQQRADTIIYLELPLIVCLYRVVKRRVMYHGKTRPDLGEGCPEKLDAAFLKFIVTTYSGRKIKMRKRIDQFEKENPHNQVLLLRNQKEINQFANGLSEKMD